MRKLLLLLIICVISLTGYSQNHRSETIIETFFAKALTSSLNVITYYDDDLNITGYYFYIIGRDRYYAHIYESITVFRGDAKDLYVFLEKLEAYAKKFKDEDELSGTVQGVPVMHVKKYGLRYTYLYEPDQSGGHYFEIKDSEITKYKEKLVDFCNKNNIQYQ
jgi:hypothetical protein